METNALIKAQWNESAPSLPGGGLPALPDRLPPSSGFWLQFQPRPPGVDLGSVICAAPSQSSSESSVTSSSHTLPSPSLLIPTESWLGVAAPQTHRPFLVISAESTLPVSLGKKGQREKELQRQGDCQIPQQSSVLQGLLRAPCNLSASY